MKRRTVVMVALLLVGVTTTMLSIRRYHIWQFEAGCQVLWHDDECFVFIGQNTAGWQGSYLEEVYLTAKEHCGFDVAPRILREDVMMYHFQHNELKRYYLKGLSSTNSFYPYNGVLHYFMGSDGYSSPPTTWRWNGSEFVKLAAAESEQIGDSFKLLSELPTREGWFEYRRASLFPEKEKSYAIKLDQTQLILTVYKSPDDSRYKKITLKGPGLTEPEAVLIERDGAWKRVDKETYFQFIETKDGTSTSQ